MNLEKHFLDLAKMEKKLRRNIFNTLRNQKIIRINHVVNQKNLQSLSENDRFTTLV